MSDAVVRDLGGSVGRHALLEITLAPALLEYTTTTNLRSMGRQRLSDDGAQSSERHGRCRRGKVFSKVLMPPSASSAAYAHFCAPPGADDGEQALDEVLAPPSPLSLHVLPKRTSISSFRSPSNSLSLFMALLILMRSSEY